MSQSPANAPTEQIAASSADERPPFLRIMAAPWIALVRPRQAGRLIRRAGPLAVAMLFAQLFVVPTVLVVLLVAWESMTYLDHQVMDPWTTEPTATLPEDRSIDQALKHRSLAEALRLWSRWGWVPLGDLAIGVAALVLIYTLLAVFCPLPRVYDGGRISQTLHTCVRLPPLSLGWVTVTVLLFGTLQVLCLDASEAWQAQRWVEDPAGSVDTDWWEVASFGRLLATPVLVWLLLNWLLWAARGATDPMPAPAGSRCIGCGYSLEYVPPEGRCPECAESTNHSLSPETRPGLDWQARRFDPVANFVRTSFWLFLRPGKAYAEARTRGLESRAWAFDRFHVVLLALAAVLAAVLAEVVDALRGSGTLLLRDPPWDVLIPAIIALWLILLGWVVHRAIGAVTVIVAAVRGDGVDAKALAGAVGYESAFLWAFFALNAGARLFYYPRFDKLTSAFMGLGLPGSTAGALFFWLVPLANLALLLLWMLRYRAAYRALRWANF